MSPQVISAKGVHLIALALRQDGYEEPSVIAMSSLADNNWARGMNALTRKSIPLFDRLPFYTFDVPVEDRRGRGVSKIKQDVVLPHEAFAALYAHHRSRFHEIMATHAAQEFWSRQPESRLRTLPGWTADRAARTMRLLPVGSCKMLYHIWLRMFARQSARCDWRIP